jgi:hypothetical protein
MLAVQVPAQAVIPLGVELTVPPPLAGLVETVRVRGPALNVAVTLWAAVIVTAQAPAPLQPAPLQPVKVSVPLGVAVRVTTVP